MRDPSVDRTADERIRRWKRTLDPQDMWPETTNDQRLRAYREIFAATSRVLAGQKASLSLATTDDVRAAGIVAFVSGMGPVLGRWVEGGQLGASQPMAALLADHLAHGRRRAEEMTVRLTRLTEAMAKQGIVPTILKGTYTSRRYFEEPGLRPAADIDVLVANEEFAGACEALRSMGLQSLAGHAMPYREEWGPIEDPIVHSAEMTHVDNPWSVDLHRSLDREYFPGLIAGFGYPDNSLLEPWSGPFGSVRVLREPLLSAHLAVHTSADFPNLHLIRVVELILVLRAGLASGRITWEALMDLLRRTRTRRFAYPAFGLAARLAPEFVSTAFLEELAGSATPRMRRTLPDAAVVPPQHFAQPSLEMRLAWAKGPFQIASNILSWIYPTGAEVSALTRLRIFRRRLGLVLRGRVTWRPNGTEPEK
jgi:hypothetical protein